MVVSRGFYKDNITTVTYVLCHLAFMACDWQSKAFIFSIRCKFTIKPFINHHLNTKWVSCYFHKKNRHGFNTIKLISVIHKPFVDTLFVEKSVNMKFTFLNNQLWQNTHTQNASTSSSQLIVSHGFTGMISIAVPDSNVHGANMGSIWGRQDPCWPHELCYLGWYCSLLSLFISNIQIIVTSFISLSDYLQFHLPTTCIHSRIMETRSPKSLILYTVWTSAEW